MTNEHRFDAFTAALEQGTWGSFPFGQPNLRRPPTLPTDTSGPVLAVLGVYPSALHLSWRAPDVLSGKPTIGALAVDIEPTVFWAGDNGPKRDQRIEAWKSATHDDGTHGDFGWVGLNGTSGAGVVENYLTPLGVSYAQCFLTNCVPFYFVKSGANEQGGVINAKWRPYAESNGWPGGQLPQRPSTTTLVEMAAHPARKLAEELASTHPIAIVTLGQEAADTLNKVGEVIDPPPGLPLQAHDDAYGNPGKILLDGREVTWIPLAHPGATGRADTDWYTCHDDWKATARRLVDE